VLSDHSLPWTEEEYLALGETDVRVELVDGGLILSPAPTQGHQATSSELYLALRSPAEAAGLQVYGAINERLRHGRIAIPDLVVTEPVDPGEVVSDAPALRLFRLDGDHYVEHASGASGQPLTLTEPVAVSLNPDELSHWW